MLFGTASGDWDVHEIDEVLRVSGGHPVWVGVGRQRSQRSDLTAENEPTCIPLDSVVSTEDENQMAHGGQDSVVPVIDYREVIDLQMSRHRDLNHMT